jgi:hypothetical protein
MISEPVVYSTQTIHLSCIKISTIYEKDRNELPHEPRHLALPSSASKMISEPMVCLTQTMHLSCTDTITVYKQEQARFHMTHVTKEFHQVCPKWFWSLWYVRHKPWTYLTSRLALSLKGPKRASTWASSPRGTNECVQNDFLSLWYF